MEKKFIFFLVSLTSNLIWAQDIHWSQPTNALIYQNPAFTGIAGKYNIDASYNSQWNAVNSKYATYMFAGDFRFRKKSKSKLVMSMGGMALKDKTGDGKLTTTSAGITLSVLVKISKKIYVGAGFGGNMMQNTLQPSNLTWGSQYDGIGYNSGLSSGENDVVAAKFVPDFNTGVSASYDRSGGSAGSRSAVRFIGGYSLNHLTRPNIDMLGGVDKIHFKHTVMVTGLIGITKQIGIKPIVLTYMQGKLIELNFGGLMRYGIGQQSKITGYKKGSAISFGVLYRLKDAVIPTVELEKGIFLLGLSYDVNVSNLKVASKLRGGFQVSLKLSNVVNYLYKYKAKI